MTTDHPITPSSPHWEQRWREMIAGEAVGPGAGAARAGLWALAAVYGGVIGAYRLAYDLGILRTVAASCRVISVGNLTVGGTGKSTTVRWIVERLRERGIPVAVLSYGYRPPQIRGTPAPRGGAPPREEAVTIVSDGQRVLVPEAISGDEPRMLAEALPGVPVLIGKRRQLSAAEAVRQFGVRVCVLDDAFQYWRLKKDLDIVLIDALCPFGGGYLLPRGLLREAPRQLRRAHALVLTNAHLLSEGEREALRRSLRRLNPRAVMAEARHAPRRLYPLAAAGVQVRGSRVVAAQQTAAGAGPRGCSGVQEAQSEHLNTRTPEHLNTRLRGCRVLALSSLGNPEGFERTLAGLGAEVVPARYPDHHHYCPAELEREAKRAGSEGCAMIVTTEKDAMKIDPAWAGAVPILVLSVELEFDAGQEDVESLLDALVA